MDQRIFYRKETKVIILGVGMGVSNKWGFNEIQYYDWYYILYM